MADTPDDQPAADEFVEATKPPEVEEGTGIALVDGYAVNHRLRAEALANEGKAEDPAGHITPDMIVATADRLAAERRDAEAAEKVAAANAPSMSWSRADLVAEAAQRGVTVESDANKAAILAALQAAPTAGNEG